MDIINIKSLLKKQAVYKRILLNFKKFSEETSTSDNHTQSAVDLLFHFGQLEKLAKYF